MSVQQFVNWCNRVADGLEELAVMTADAAAEEAYERALTYSSGTYSKLEQRALYRTVKGRRRGPYSAVAPRPPLPPYIINTWDGVFLESWEIAPMDKLRGDIYACVSNNAPQAEFMGGTALMIERPLPAKVVEELEEPNFQGFQRRVVRLLRR